MYRKQLLQHPHQKFSDVEGLDSALFGTWTETTADPNINDRRINISFTSDVCVIYWSYYDTTYGPIGEVLDWWTVSNQLFTSESDGTQQDVGDYEIVNSELHLSHFARMDDELNNRKLAK